MAESWTPAQQKILDILSDGEPHKMEELVEGVAIVWEEPLLQVSAVHQQLSKIRSKLPPDEIILCQRVYKWNFFRHVRRLKVVKTS